MNKIYTSLLILFFPISVFSQSIPGDITNDGIVDTLDVIRGIEIILHRGLSPTQGEITAGDLNRDQIINVADIRLISNLYHFANLPPIADASASDTTGLTGNLILLDASNSIDYNGDSLKFMWHQLHGTRSTRKYITANIVSLSDTSNSEPSF
ncbi:dockerin type I domain-containing protein, partial [Calditrichota bacterium]